MKKGIAALLIVSVCLMGSGCRRKPCQERVKKAIASITQEQVETLGRLAGVPEPFIQGIKLVKGAFF